MSEGLERRGFLRGLFGGVVASGLIVKATNAEVEHFAAPLKPNAPIDLMRPHGPRTIGRSLYDKHGNRVAMVSQDAQIRIEAYALSQTSLSWDDPDEDA